MLVPVLGLAAGIYLYGAGCPYWISFVLVISTLPLYSLLIRAGRNPLNSYKTNRLHFIWIFLIFCALGIFTSKLNFPIYLDNPDKIAACRGIVTETKNTTSGDKIIIEANAFSTFEGESLKAPGVKILLTSDAVDAEAGDEIICPVQLEEISDSQNYFSGGYADYYKKKGIFYQSHADSNVIKIVSSKNTLNGFAFKIRQSLESFIENTPISKATQNFLITILLGDRNYLDKETRSIFADAGISHILALSGMHIAIITGILLFLLFPLNFTGRHKLKYLLVVAVLFFYTFITGLNPSTVRAAIMLTATTVCILLERKNSAWNSLLTAIFFILIFSPYSIYDIGLQLSFLCVASLIFFVRPLNPFDRHQNPYYHAIATAVLTSMVATTATWCLSAYYFGTIPLMFLPVNIIVVPLLPFYVTVAIIYLTLYAIGIDASWLGAMLDGGHALLNNFTDLMTRGGNTSLQISPSTVTLIIWSLILIVAAVWVTGRKSLLKWAGGVLAICLIVSVANDSEANQKNGYIIQNGIGNVNILTKKGIEESLVKIDKKSVSEFSMDGHRLLIIDGYAEFNELEKKDYEAIVLAGNFHDDLGSLLNKVSAEKIIIHPSVRKIHENKLIEAADSLGIQHHSIRHKGAFLNQF